jgi:sterol desaturase/sphingolipid hydroxylase (fatty acid hydroxylase superfamily)
VPSTETIFAAVILVALSALALYFGRQQLQALRSLRDQPELPPEDFQYARRQALLRLVGCLLLVVLGAQVGAAFIFGLEDRVKALGLQIEAQRAQGQPLQLDADQQALRRFYGFYWIAALIILLLIVFLAAYDIWSIRRYGRRHMMKLHAERRAMLEGEVARRRSERNGHG